MPTRICKYKLDTLVVLDPCYINLQYQVVGCKLPKNISPRIFPVDTIVSSFSHHFPMISPWFPIQIPYKPSTAKTFNALPFTDVLAWCAAAALQGSVLPWRPWPCWSSIFGAVDHGWGSSLNNRRTSTGEARGCPSYLADSWGYPWLRSPVSQLPIGIILQVIKLNITQGICHLQAIVARWNKSPKRDKPTSPCLQSSLREENHPYFNWLYLPIPIGSNYLEWCAKKTCG